MLRAFLSEKLIFSSQKNFFLFSIFVISKNPFWKMKLKKTAGKTGRAEEFIPFIFCLVNKQREEYILLVYLFSEFSLSGGEAKVFLFLSRRRRRLFGVFFSLFFSLSLFSSNKRQMLFTSFELFMGAAWKKRHAWETTQD